MLRSSIAVALLALLVGTSVGCGHRHHRDRRDRDGYRYRGYDRYHDRHDHYHCYPRHYRGRW